MTSKEATQRRGRILLVMLPGMGMEPRDFADHGMVAAVDELGLGVDSIAAHLDPNLYLYGDVAAALHRDVVEPALAQGYTRLWLLGISLGGMGALLYASRFVNHVEGVVLLAPFLGTQGVVAEIVEAGGLLNWLADRSSATAPERQVLTWLQDYVSHRPLRPALYLAYGRADRFVQGHGLLTQYLPGCVVVSDAGGHDWPTWLDLWRRMLNLGLFAEQVAQ